MRYGVARRPRLGVAGTIVICLVACLATERAAAQVEFIDLGNVVAGGDGVNAPPEGNIGINADTGAFIQARLAAGVPEADLINPKPVDGFDGASESAYIDSVFIMDVGIGQLITTTLVPFDFAADDVDTGWEGILNGREPGGPDSLSFGNAGPFERGVGLHAAQGITFDLDALRDAHGAENVRWFSAILGEGSGQATGNVNTYVILSSEDEVLASESVLGSTDSGEFVQLEVPDEALFLTLATGAAGDGIGNDHGAFGLAQLSAEEQTVERTGLDLRIPQTVLAPGGTTQLTTVAIDDLGLETDVTAAADGTTYSVEPEGVVSVGPDGLVTAESVGSATITAEDGEFSASVDVLVEFFIDLGNIAAGGDGVEPPPAGNIGINADTGTFVQARINADVPEADGFNPKLVDGIDGADSSAYLDSVFIIDLGPGQPISSGEALFDFDVGDVAGGWGAILDGREIDGPDSIGFTNQGPFPRGVGCHAAQGITYDLDALRDLHGEDAVQHVQCIAGEAAGQAGGNVNAYVILSSEEEVLASEAVLGASDSGELIEMEIPGEALFLTLAVGAAGDGIGSDHGAFGLAQVTGAPIDRTNLGSITVSPSIVNLEIDDSQTLSLSGVIGAGAFEGITVDVDPAEATFTSDNEAVATVDENGVITGVADGRTRVRVQLGDTEAEVRVSVGTVIDLGDVVRGGDGLGGEFVFSIGIDPRDGALVSEGMEGAISEMDPVSDGLNPSEVPDTELVDSVFFIGPATADPPPDTFAQQINLSGATFDFPGVDAIGTGWNFILANRNGGVNAAGMRVGGQDFERGVGVHASMGVTFDLDALRDAYGEERIGTLSTFWGMDDCGGGDVNLYAIFSDADGVISFESAGFVTGEGAFLEVGIPSDASFLTLATGSNGGDGCDHGSFAEAIIAPGGGPEPGTQFVRGDADASGEINITDGISILNFLFTGGEDPPCEDAADVDNSNTVNITDGIAVLNFLFTGGADPAAPYPECGTDPDEDETVGCAEAHPGCL